MAKKTVKRPARNAWSEMTDLAERLVESQRTLFHRLIEAVTPPPAHPTPKSRTTRAVHARRTSRKPVTRRAAKRVA